MAKFMVYLTATKNLEKMKLVKAEKGTLDTFLNEGNLWSHGRFLLGFRIMEFFRNELRNENLDPDSKKMCEEYLNNWIIPANIALQIDESQNEAKI